MKAGKNLQETINFLIDQAIKRDEKKVYCTIQDLEDVITAIKMDNKNERPDTTFTINFKPTSKPSEQ